MQTTTMNRSVRILDFPLHPPAFKRALSVLLSGLALAGSLLGHTLTAASDAATRLPNLFGDNMVLQRDASVNIWGWDAPGVEVKVRPSWGEPVVAVSDDTGYWKASIQTLGAGGPHELAIEGTGNVQLENILFGEVWLCSGQSNMEMPLKGYPNQPIVNSQSELLRANQPSIRFFRVSRQRSDVPETDVQGEWQVCTPRTIGDFSAVAYFFGDKLTEHLDVPIGLIGSYWGGTSAEAWTDRSTLAARFPESDLVVQSEQSPGPGQLFNGMIHPVIPYTIKGVIWYQGETNRVKPGVYASLFPAMVEDWRVKWNQGEFPFYYVQIAPFLYDGAHSVSSALLREAQLKASTRMNNAAMVVSLDHGNAGCIHPFNKRPIGERLAGLALKNEYGFRFLQTEGPVLREMKIEGSQAILSFDNAPNGIISLGVQLDEFQIAGSDKVFHPAAALVNRNGTLSVSSPEVADPVAVRYAFRNAPEATLFNIEGLPASSFRTDDW